MPQLTIDQLPDLSGKVTIVTGANSGLGLESSRVLALKGAQVIMACRNPAKAKAARNEIASGGLGERLELRTLDLASLASVRQFAEGIQSDFPHIDILLNNAGVMAPPRGLTADGFELQFGTNHLGHFALTGLLLDALKAAPAGRVVGVTSVAAFSGRIFFDDLSAERRYWRYMRYCQSKYANLLHIREMDRRLRAAKSTVSAIAAHPGYSNTNLQHNTANASGNILERIGYAIGNPGIAMPVWKGTLPQMYAAAMPDAKGGAMYGPDGFQQAFGWPTECRQPGRAHKEEIAKRLWAVSEEMTGVAYL